MAAVGDHYRIGGGDTGADLPAGVYRVVGTPGEDVTLLRVGDADGRRVHTGAVHRVAAAELAAAESAAPPKDGIGTMLSAVATAAYWSSRVFVRELVGHPLATVAALSLVVAGRLTALPAGVRTVLVVAGALGLAYVGSGRL